MQQRDLAQPQVDRVGPAAAAVRLARTPATALLVSVALGLAATWLGIGLAYATGWPVGFFITAIVTVCYVVTRFTYPRHTARSARGAVVDFGMAGTAHGCGVDRPDH